MTGVLAFREGVVGGKAANYPLPTQNPQNACHSERSEESVIINRAEVFFIKTLPLNCFFRHKKNLSIA